MEEEDEQSSQEEGAVECKEFERALPSLVEEDLDKLGLKEGEVSSVGEVLCESQSKGVVGWREFEAAPVNLGLSLLIPAFLSEFLQELPLVGFFELESDFFIGSLSVDFFHLRKSSLVEELKLHANALCLGME